MDYSPVTLDAIVITIIYSVLILWGVWRDARPWAPMLNWVVITAIYVLTAVAVHYRKVIFAAPPDPARPEHVPSLLEGILVVGINVGIAMFGWGMTRRYTGPGPAAELIPAVGGELNSRAEAAAEPKR